MKAIINKKIASLYKEPSDKSELIDEALFGACVEILDKKQGYCYIRTPYRYEGFVQEEALLKGSAFLQKWESMPKMTVFTSYIDVLIAPDMKASKIISITKGGILACNGIAGADMWQEVMLPCGTIGYTKAGYLRRESTMAHSASEEQLRMALCTNALSYMGVQYRWGGKTPLGIDCSGLVSMAYLLEGIVIYRDADIRDGFAVHEIKVENAKKGDLFYFPGHVAMYLGNGDIIHSTQHAGTEGVVLASLKETNPLYREDLRKSIIKAGSVF